MSDLSKTYVEAPVFWVGARWNLAEVVDYLRVHLGGDEHAALLMLLAHLDGEPGRLAAAREEQREADARRLEAFFIGNERMTRAEAMQMQAAANIVRQGPPHDSTPLADEIRTLRADLDVAESRKSQAIHDLHARAEKAEARVRELEAESSTWAKACGEEMRKRQSMEANWENMAANNREFCARAAKAEAERDEARAEVERLRAQVEECNEGVRYWTELARAEAEDAARLRAKVERVRGELVQERARGTAQAHIASLEERVLDALEGK